MELLLIILLTLFCWTVIIYLLHRDIFFTYFFLLLWIYTIFTQLGYIYYPEAISCFSIRVEEDSFYNYWFFVMFSLILIFVGMYILLHRKQKPIFHIEKCRIKLQIVSVFLLAFPFLYFFFNVINNIFDFSYMGITSSGNTKILFSASYLMFGIIFFALWARFRSHSLRPTDKIIITIFIIIYAFIYFWTGMKTGDRSSLIGMFLGILAYEFLPMQKNIMRHKKKIAILVLLLLFFILLLQRIASLRGYGEISLTSLFFDSKITSNSIYVVNDFKDLLFQDYFYPSLMLFVSQDLQFTDPGEVLTSNLFNSLILFNYPTLSQTVGSFIVNTTRTQGFAYYILTEGYNFVGYLGVIYNGILVTLGLAIWRRFAQSNDFAFNRYMIGLMSTQIIQIVRSQTCYFFKDVYLVIIPGMLIYFFICNQKPVFTRRL